MYCVDQPAFETHCFHDLSLIWAANMNTDDHLMPQPLLQLLKTVLQPLLPLVFLESLQAQKLLKGSLAVHPDGLSFHLRHWDVWLKEQCLNYFPEFLVFFQKRSPYGPLLQNGSE